MERPDGAYKKNTRVVCSTTGFVAGTIDDLGIVLYSGAAVELPKEHEDGAKGEVFVMSWDKTKIIAVKDLPGMLSGMLHLLFLTTINLRTFRIKWLVVGRRDSSVAGSRPGILPRVLVL